MKRPFALTALVLCTGIACAQAIVHRSQDYISEPQLPFARKATPAPAAAPASATVVAAAAPALAAPPAVPAPPEKAWEIRVKDIHLASTFHRWATDAGYRVRWDAAKHVLVEAPDTIRGSFESALQQVLESPGIAQGAYPLEVCFYPNTPPLARITRKGDQDKECH